MRNVLFYPPPIALSSKEDKRKDITASEENSIMKEIDMRLDPDE